jgi:hypothetical protein
MEQMLRVIIVGVILLHGHGMLVQTKLLQAMDVWFIQVQLQHGL